MNHKLSSARSAALVVAATLVGMFAATPAMAVEPGAPPPAPVTWGACPADVVDPFAQLQCAVIPVPLDYDNPEGEKIDLTVSRLSSANPAERRGILMLNPGGPGGSGLAQPNQVVELGLPASVMNSYDVLGMDTRGIGHSAPISCGFTTDSAYLGAVPPYAVDDAAVVAQADIARSVAEQCAANNVAGHLQQISTANMARDLDQIRIALGEEKMSFWGLSYGSALGAAYASMFPDTSDRVMLDSNIGDTHADRDAIRRYGQGTEETFPDFAKWAAERDGAYQLGSTPQEVRNTYFDLAEQLDSEPVIGISGHLFRLNTFVSLYSESTYPQAAQLWQLLLNPDEAATSPMAPPAVLAGEPNPNDNTFSVFLAVTCNDAEFPSDVAAYQTAVAEDRERYPVFGAAGANIMPCAFWPYELSEPPVPINDDGPENILVLQNERDPATPLAGGELIREKFENRSRLVTADASGHGVYLYGDNACVDNIATEFLIDGVLPTEDVQC
jgi:pimeloyl-ACP methyl ester carboxylesterase